MQSSKKTPPWATAEEAEVVHTQLGPNPGESRQATAAAPRGRAALRRRLQLNAAKNSNNDDENRLVREEDDKATVGRVVCTPSCMSPARKPILHLNL